MPRTSAFLARALLLYGAVVRPAGPLVRAARDVLYVPAAGLTRGQALRALACIAAFALLITAISGQVLR